MTTSSFDAYSRAQRHNLNYDGPAVNFFSGALLGNGGLGAVVTTRPDAIAIHFGHNNVWDIRVAEQHQDKIGTFAEIFARVDAIPSDYRLLEDDPWYRDYVQLMGDNYRKPYPRPFPCGSLILGFDPRRSAMLGYSLAINNGQCTVHMEVQGQRVDVVIFVDMEHERLWLRAQDADGQPVASPFERIRLLPDPEGLLGEPAREQAEQPDTINLGVGLTTPKAHQPQSLSFRQQLPYLAPEHPQAGQTHAKDRAFRLSASVSCRLGKRTRHSVEGLDVEMNALEYALEGDQPFVVCVELDEGLASAIPTLPKQAITADLAGYTDATEASDQSWRSYWSRSGVALADQLLEQTWYRNLYFLNCSLRAGVTCPGLFANWSYRRLGSEWHGDYHMNYNTQQPFWCVFSSNHIDKHIPYVDLVDHMMPISRKWAQEYYGLRGAYFPHSAYPTDMQISPYPVPTWGWEICETPWTVQSLWWHYRYTLDRDFLSERAYEPIKAAVEFMTDYMLRPDARGERWGDDRYHIFPTVSPELYGLTPGFAKSYDCLVDLTLTRFLFNAFSQACEILGSTDQPEEARLLADVAEILRHYPDYPTAEADIGTVFVSVPGENPNIVYNTPNPVMTVFPGEEHGLHSPPELYEIAVNSHRNMRNEGGNELVFSNLQAARLGILDHERFKRQIRYCTLPNGTCTDLVLQVHGRYKDTTSYDYMAHMGIWFENFGLPVVINESMLQSYNGVLRFFPNWPAASQAEFHTLRAVGAHLVSAAWSEGSVEWIEITSEQGADLQLIVPWPEGAQYESALQSGVLPSGEQKLSTSVGETLRLRRA
jgi:alpha-L-fucosidase 2